MRKLTIIIPFLNEKEEVGNTLESIRNYADDGVDILLINDGSDDGYRYKEEAGKYNARYIENPQRLGVAASRDLGVELCTTPYFLFLDAHMRFYDSLWVEMIPRELEENDRVLLCCQTLTLFKKDGKVEMGKETRSMGAQIDFRDDFLNISWKYKELLPQASIEPIPCVLGAAYAASRRYWLYLKGLTGLKNYGSDEAYISLKVWLEGGACKLLKNRVVGHIYRNRAPYTIETVDTIYNRILIADLLLPALIKDKVFECLEMKYASFFREAEAFWHRDREAFRDLRSYYQSIFTRNFDWVLLQNQGIGCDEIEKKETDPSLTRMAGHIYLNCPFISDIGLLHGKMGFTLFFFHYARLSGDRFYQQFAEHLLDDIFNNLREESPVCFGEGLMGIAWGVAYLLENGFVEGDSNEILEDIDKKIITQVAIDTDDLSLNSGLEGILWYTSVRREAWESLVDRDFYMEFLSALEGAVGLVCPNDDRIAIRAKWNMGDLLPVSGQTEEDIYQYPLGLVDGCAGKGLKMILG